MPVTAVVIGAVDHGARAYAPYALVNPHELKLWVLLNPLGGDYGIIRSFIWDINNLLQKESITSATISLIYIMAVAAEESRLHQVKSMNLNDYYQHYKN